MSVAENPPILTVYSQTELVSMRRALAGVILLLVLPDVTVADRALCVSELQGVLNLLEDKS